MLLRVAIRSRRYAMVALLALGGLVLVGLLVFSAWRSGPGGTQ